MTESVRTPRVSDDGEIVVDVIDQVGNALTHTVRWCKYHVCVAMVYTDGSIDCHHDAVVHWSPHEHRLGVDVVPIKSQFVL